MGAVWHPSCPGSKRACMHPQPHSHTATQGCALFKKQQQNPEAGGGDRQAATRAPTWLWGEHEAGSEGQPNHGRPLVGTIVAAAGWEAAPISRHASEKNGGPSCALLCVCVAGWGEGHDA